MSDEDVSIDDLVMEDEFEEFREEFKSEIEDIRESAGGEGVDAEDIQNVADQTFMQRMEHILTEDCDSEACNQIRESLPDAHTHADDGADAEADPDDDPDQTTGGDHPEADAEGGDDDEGEAEESSSDDGDDDDRETNIFGEPV